MTIPPLSPSYGTSGKIFQDLSPKLARFFIKLEFERGFVRLMFQPSELARVKLAGGDDAFVYLRIVIPLPFEVLPHLLSVEGGELTPTMKVKRNIINVKYKAIIDGMYVG